MVHSLPIYTPLQKHHRFRVEHRNKEKYKKGKRKPEVGCTVGGPCVVLRALLVAMWASPLEVRGAVPVLAAAEALMYRLVARWERAVAGAQEAVSGDIG